MSIHEHLPLEARKELKQVGWPNGLELAKVARRDLRAASHVKEPNQETRGGR
jgi:hypothetical protein